MELHCGMFLSNMGWVLLRQGLILYDISNNTMTTMVHRIELRKDTLSCKSFGAYFEYVEKTEYVIYIDIVLTLSIILRFNSNCIIIISSPGYSSFKSLMS